MEKGPDFIKKFSKEESPEERKEAAREIMEKRREYFSRKKEKEEKREELERSVTEKERFLAEYLGSLEELVDELEEISSSGLKKILNYLELRKLRAEISSREEEYEDLKREHKDELAKKQEMEESLEQEETRPELQEAKRMLKDFYRRQEEKWENSKFTKENVLEYFSDEHLASLSVEEYALLLKRFPGEMVTHVTRQGIRDHSGHAAHNFGEGKYFDSFMKVLEDKRLRSPLGVSLMEREKEDAVAKHLQLEGWDTKEEAQMWLDDTTADLQAEPGSYADIRAVHFAAEKVADTFYGSEKGNEIFIAYPSTYIASKYYFGGDLSAGEEEKHNDKWVWANEEEGMSLDSGLVFLPAEAQVDKNTGSRYELDENKSPIVNTEFIESFKKAVETEGFIDFISEAWQITSGFSAFAKENFSCMDDISGLSEQDEELLGKIAPLRKRLKNEFGVIDPKLQLTMIHPQYINILKGGFARGKENLDGEAIAQEFLIEEGILYKEAEDTISSQEFWENYFSEHPEKRPSKIIYYEGRDPTQALIQWRDGAGIKKRMEDGTFGFPENHVNVSSPEEAKKVTPGIERYRSLGQKIIDERYKEEVE